MFLTWVFFLSVSSETDIFSLGQHFKYLRKVITNFLRINHAS